MSHGHFKKVCRKCGAVIAQCRCIGPKTVEYGICEKCAQKNASATTRSPEAAGSGEAPSWAPMATGQPRVRAQTAVEGGVGPPRISAAYTAAGVAESTRADYPPSGLTYEPPMVRSGTRERSAGRFTYRRVAGRFTYPRDRAPRARRPQCRGNHTTQGGGSHPHRPSPIGGDFLGLITASSHPRDSRRRQAHMLTGQSLMYRDPWRNPP